jgi:hypothetical protein
MHGAVFERALLRSPRCSEAHAIKLELTQTHVPQKALLRFEVDEKRDTALSLSDFSFSSLVGPRFTCAWLFLFSFGAAPPVVCVFFAVSSLNGGSVLWGFYLTQQSSSRCPSECGVLWSSNLASGTTSKYPSLSPRE